MSETHTRHWPSFVVGSIAFIMASFIGPGQVNAAFAGSFSDVADDEAFSTEIEWLAARDITAGWYDAESATRKFRPDDTISRDAMAAFLYRYAGAPLYSPPSKSPFSDVRTTDSFYKEISWLASRGISTGWAMPDGTVEFRPLSSISRDAMAAFLYRYAGSPERGQSSGTFADVPADSQFATEIEWLAGMGIATGWSDGTFRPLHDVSRQAMASFLFQHTAKLSNRPLGTNQAAAEIEAFLKGTSGFREVIADDNGCTVLGVYEWDPATSRAVVTVTSCGADNTDTSGAFSTVHFIDQRKVTVSEVYVDGLENPVWHALMSPYDKGAVKPTSFIRDGDRLVRQPTRNPKP